MSVSVHLDRLLAFPKKIVYLTDAATPEHRCALWLLNILSIDQRRDYFVTVFMYKFWKSMLPSMFVSMFIQVFGEHHYSYDKLIWCLLSMPLLKSKIDWTDNFSKHQTFVSLLLLILPQPAMDLTNINHNNCFLITNPVIMPLQSRCV